MTGGGARRAHGPPNAAAMWTSGRPGGVATPAASCNDAIRYVSDTEGQPADRPGLQRRVREVIDGGRGGADIRRPSTLSPKAGGAAKPNPGAAAKRA